MAKHKIKYPTSKQLTLKEILKNIDNKLGKFDNLAEEEGGDPKA